MSRNTRKSRRPRKIVEKSEIFEALDNPEVDLTDAIDAVRVLDILELPLFEQILISHLCRDLNLVSQSNSKIENLQLFRRIFFKIKEIKRRKPQWELSYAFRKSSYFRRKMNRERRTVLTQEEAEELTRFEKEKELLSKVQIEKSFLENLHLFQTLIDQRVTEKGRGWLYSYRILNLHRLVIHEPHSFEYELIL